MNLSTAYIFVAILATLYTGIVARPENKELPLNVPYYAGCGGKLEDVFAAITYKPDTSVSSNERCVWTVRSPTAAGYNLEVLSYGLQGGTSGLGISATCILLNNEQATHMPIDKTGVVNLPACPVLVLTFYSGENVVNSRGFVMIYEEIAGVTGISASSKHYDITNQAGHIRHPLSVEEFYTESELSTFIFAPPNNVHNPERRVLVTYTKDSLQEDLCVDSLRVHRFSPIGGWAHDPATDHICGDVEYRSWYSDDLLMVVFRTDGADVGRGFHITHTNLP